MRFIDSMEYSVLAGLQSPEQSVRTYTLTGRGRAAEQRPKIKFKATHVGPQSPHTTGQGAPPPPFPRGKLV